MSLPLIRLSCGSQLFTVGQPELMADKWCSHDLCYRGSAERTVRRWRRHHGSLILHLVPSVVLTPALSLIWSVQHRLSSHCSWCWPFLLVPDANNLQETTLLIENLLCPPSAVLQFHQSFCPSGNFAFSSHIPFMLQNDEFVFSVPCIILSAVGLV